MRACISRVCLPLVLLSILVWPSPALADAAVMAPTQGEFGSVVSVSPAATAGDTFLVKWDGVDYVTGTVDTALSITFTVPAAIGGAHTIIVQSPTGTQIFTGTYTVLPSLTATPVTGTAGTSVSVSGNGFQTSETGIALTYDGTAVMTGLTADASGAWTTSFAVPTSAGGAHLLDAVGASTTAVNVADKTFTVTPKIVASTPAGTAGTNVTITGSGFAVSETNIRVTYDGGDVKTGITADANGSWTASIVAPASSRGTHIIDAAGNTTAATSIPDLGFSMSSGITVDKNSGFVGDTINVSGNGFGQGETGIIVTFDSAPAKTGITADAIGHWAASLAVPSATKGTHTIDAYGSMTSGTEVPDLTFTISPRLILTPAGGNVGTPVTVSGTGFASTKAVTVTYSGTPVLPGVSTNATGGFSGSFNAPKGLHGQINIVATDAAGTTAAAAFAMESTPPSIPAIISPAPGGRAGMIGNTRVTFAWSDVSDPSGVTYELQVSERTDFVTSLIKQTGLTSAAYSATDAEALPPGEFYWRVRAIDGAGNASEWTSPTLLKTAYVSTLIFIVAISVLLLLGLLLIILIVAMRRPRW